LTLWKRSPSIVILIRSSIYRVRLTAGRLLWGQAVLHDRLTEPWRAHRRICVLRAQELSLQDREHEDWGAQDRV
jgi:hypothetical protein